MKIKNINIKNYKFHHNLEFKITKQNCLIYGENGTGKSSIYWALYSIFKPSNIDVSMYQKYGTSEPLNVKVDLEKIQLETDVNSEIILYNSSTIYFADQDLLNSMIIDSNDFYITIVKTLKKYFFSFDTLYQGYMNINNIIDNENYSEKILDKQTIDTNFKKFLDVIQDKANEIIMALGEEFIIDFSFEEGEVEATGISYKISNPKITLEINNLNNLKLYFNEAKLKLTSIAIFFALIKLEENQENQLKLLVLDDFLTSLDMGNRHYIIEYIFNNFQDYQIILLTHNLQFYNLILDWLNTHNRDSEWDIKNIYIRYNENREESIIYSKNVDYISEAEIKLSNGEFQNAGNLIRKEFELLIHEFEKLYRLGKREESDTILSLILKDKPIYFKQNQLLESISRDINHCKNMSNDIERNKDRIKEKLEKISNEIQENSSVSNEHLKSILENLIFYRKIVLNRASHNNPDIEIYQREYRNSLRVIKKLKILLDDLK